MYMCIYMDIHTYVYICRLVYIIFLHSRTAMYCKWKRGLHETVADSMFILRGIHIRQQCLKIQSLIGHMIVDHFRIG